MPFLYLLLCLYCFSCQQEQYSTTMLEDYLILDKTIQQQNTLINHSTQHQLTDFEEKCRSKPSLQIFANKAKKIVAISDELITYIADLRTQMINESGGIYTEKEANALGKPMLKDQIKNLEDQNAIHKILLSSQEFSKQTTAQVLVEKIQKIEVDCIDLIAELWDNGGIKGTIFINSSKKTTALKQLKEEFTFDSYKDKHWAKKTFDQKPLAAVLPLLSKIQSDILISTQAAVFFLCFQFSITPLHYDKFDVFAQSAKPHIRLGEQYKAEIALGTYASQAPFKVQVDGKILDIVDGKAEYKITPHSIGQKTYEAKVSVFNETTQQTATFTKEFHFEVIP